MRRIVTAIVLAVVLLSLGRPAQAQNADVESGKTKKGEQAGSTEEKKTIEKRKAKTKRHGTSDTSGKDKTASQAVRDIEQAMKQSSIDITLSLDAVFLQTIREFEDAGKAPFSVCRITTRPQLPANFGLTAQIDANTIDTIMASWLSQAAQSNAPLPQASQLGILAYRDCLAQYGTIIAAAYLNLEDSLKDVKAQVVRDEKSQARSIKDLSLEDFQALAEDALRQAVQEVEAGDISTKMRRTYESLLKSVPCTWDGTVEKIRCGGALLVLSTRPELAFGGLPIYGQSGYYGYRAEYKLTNNYSLSDAIEDLSQNSTYSKWAKEVSDMAEDFEAKGNLRDAVLLKRNAWEAARSGKVGVGLSHLLPNVHSQ